MLSLSAASSIGVNGIWATRDARAKTTYDTVGVLVEIVV